MTDEECCPACRRPYRPYTVLVSFVRCTCPDAAGGGHVASLCRHCGFEAWTSCRTAPGQLLDLPTSLRLTPT